MGVGEQNHAPAALPSGKRPGTLGGSQGQVRPHILLAYVWR